jgi:carboxypeptidase family protein
MNELNPYAHRARSLGILLAALIFIACVAATSAWVVQSYVRQSDAEAPPVNLAAGGAAAAQALPSIGGVVRGPSGDGIPNVSVRLNWNDPTRPRGQINQTIFVATDALGRWTYSGVPQASLAGLSVWLTHRDYVAQNPHPAPDSLLHHNAEFVMTRGVTVAGQVVDSLGWPVGGAHVSTSQYGPRNAISRTATNGAGQFTLRHVPVGTTTVTAALDGFAAAVAQVNAADHMPPLHLVMPPARIFAGTLTDRAGQPVPDATVAIASWHGFDMPGNVQVKTDAQGRYEIRDAPADPIDVMAAKPGFFSQSRQLPAGVNQLDFVMSPVITARGHVTDARTHQPIAAFNLTVLIRPRADQPLVLNDGQPRPFANGRFNLTFDPPPGPVSGWFIQIQAPGYAPAVTPVVASGRFDFPLQPIASAATKP